MIETICRASTFDQPGSEVHDLARYCEPGSETAWVRADQPLSAAIDVFRASARMHTLPVVDAADRPVGAIFEHDVRAILYNPYGHALLNNPSFNTPCGEHCRPCPTVDRAAPLADLLTAYAASDGAEGVVVTSQSHLFGLITNRTMIRLAAEREAELAHARVARLEGVAAAGDRFIADISRLAAGLGRVAEGIQQAAEATASRTTVYSARMAAVAAATEQTASGMLDLAAQGSGLAGTVDRVSHDTVSARNAAAQAVALSEASMHRGQALVDAATAIDGTLATVQSISSQAKLLAVNAAIEAARLGHDGGGFTVVARELKQFAVKTREAASEITAHISGVHAVSTEVIDGQRAIGGAVRTIEDMTRSVDEAVGSHAATARLLAVNVDQALHASSEINTNVAEITRMVHRAAEGADAMRGMASDLAAETARLRDRVGAFVDELRAVG